MRQDPSPKPKPCVRTQDAGGPGLRGTGRRRCARRLAAPPLPRPSTSLVIFSSLPVHAFQRESRKKQQQRRGEGGDKSDGETVRGRGGPPPCRPIRSVRGGGPHVMLSRVRPACSSPAGGDRPGLAVGEEEFQASRLGAGPRSAGPGLRTLACTPSVLFPHRRGRHAVPVTWVRIRVDPQTERRGRTPLCRGTEETPPLMSQ